MIDTDLTLGLGSFFTDLLNFAEQQKNNKWNREFSEKVYEHQKYMYEDQKEQANTAVQRRVADLNAAGLNPYLAAGSGASNGGIVGVSTGNSGETPQMEQNVFDTMMNVMNTKNNLANSQVQRELTKQQILTEVENTHNKNIDTLLKQAQAATNIAQREKIYKEIEKINIEYKEKLYNLEKSKNMDLRTNDSTDARLNSIIGRMNQGGGTMINMLANNIKSLVDAGMNLKEAVNKVANALGIDPKELMKEYLENVKEGKERGSSMKYNGTGLPY